jgi:DNA topoisomerase I
VRLRRIDCSGPGLTRRRAGRGFFYLDERGRRIEDPEVVQRISDLAIPPAWRDVWIAPYANAHLQATGIDARGRKQYRYHDAWRSARDREKFVEMEQFARALPALRERVDADLTGGDALTRERVLACAVRLLDRGFFRIGSEDYAAENDSYGLATMRKEYVTLQPADAMVFDYAAKSGKRQVRGIVDPGAFEVVARLRRRRSGGGQLLAWKEGRRWRDVRSADINAYVKDVTCGDFSAKDFRTWNATVLAAVALGVAGEVADSPAGRKRAINRALAEVAHYLGNTPAVCRSSYVDPRVFDAYNAGFLIRPALERVARDPAEGPPIHHRAIERAVLDLISEREEARGLEKVAA